MEFTDTYTIVNDEQNVVDEDVVMVINDWYDNSPICDYVLPVSESSGLPYIFVKDTDKDVFFDINYAL